MKVAVLVFLPAFAEAMRLAGLLQRRKDKCFLTKLVDPDEKAQSIPMKAERISCIEMTSEEKELDIKGDKLEECVAACIKEKKVLIVLNTAGCRCLPTLPKKKAEEAECVDESNEEYAVLYSAHVCANALPVIPPEVLTPPKNETDGGSVPPSNNTDGGSDGSAPPVVVVEKPTVIPEVPIPVVPDVPRPPPGSEPTAAPPLPTIAPPPDGESFEASICDDYPFDMLEWRPRADKQLDCWMLPFCEGTMTRKDGNAAMCTKTAFTDRVKEAVVIEGVEYKWEKKMPPEIPGIPNLPPHEGPVAGDNSPWEIGPSAPRTMPGYGGPMVGNDQFGWGENGPVHTPR